MAKYYEDDRVTIYQGDCREVLRSLPADSVQCVQHIVEVFREVRWVLRKDGTVWLNLGDSYANDTKWGGSTGGKHAKGLHGQTGVGRQKVSTGVKPKDLVGVPWRVAFALQADGWWLRSDIIWSKPNPMPESVTDRPTRSHEYVFLLTKSARYFYDAEAIREPQSEGTFERYGREANRGTIPTFNKSGGSDRKNESFAAATSQAILAGGRNKRSVWTIPTQAFPDVHFATFPEALVKPCIQAGTSERGCCAECGAPWERVLQPDAERAMQLGTGYHDHRDDLTQGMSQEKKMPQPKGGYITLGWRPTCKHEGEPVPCTVLDPFAGSGTVGLVAKKAGRRAILIELKPEYCQMAVQRIGPQAVLL